METYVFVVNMKGKQMFCVSIIPPEKAMKDGLKGEVVVGFLKEKGGLRPENFVANKPFKDFMHEVIGKEILKDPFCKEEAKRVKDGSIFIIDARTPDLQGNVPPYDIIGVVKVAKGKVVKGSYERNPNHSLVSPTGMFKLSEYLEKKLIKALSKL
tara:strand:+ start:7078 stop:7542 length:465 start_codon:yes stop_codon:yes gene_type:complete